MAELTAPNSSRTFNYTGGIQTIELLPGKYKLEVWGAQGGTDVYTGGKGGYSSGEIELTTVTTLYIVVGGQGATYTTAAGGYNGGGNGGTTHKQNYGAGGGGATHIATQTGLLKNLANYKNSVLIVAGGGGGADGNGASVGAGGGLEGTGATTNQNPGTQTAGGKGGYTSSGSFGQGGNGGSNAGGGGGGWYGGSGGNANVGAPGGSGYIGGVQNGSTTAGQNTGNGKAVITCITVGYTLSVNNTPGIGNISSNVSNLNNIPAGTTVTLTVEILAGYTWVQWSGYSNSTQLSITFTMPDVSVSVIATAIPRTDTPYIVQHYLMNLDGATYTLIDTENLQGTTDANIYPDVKTFTGFTSPSVKTAKINGNGSTVVSYQYTRNKYTITVENGTSPKLQYYFEEIGSLHYTSMEDATLTFGQWSSDKSAIIYNAINKDCTFKMPAYDCTFFVVGVTNRLNSNIYKNIFPEPAIDLTFILQKMDSTLTTANDVLQENHGFEIGDVLYLDNDKKYKKAIAEDSNKSIVVGVVTHIIGRHVFTLMTSGTIPYNGPNYTDTSILYLSDKHPGKMAHYTEIENTVYVPIGVYANDKLLISTQDGSIGDKLLPYNENATLGFEMYTEAELNDIINQAISGVRT